MLYEVITEGFQVIIAAPEEPLDDEAVLREIEVRELKRRKEERKVQKIQGRDHVERQGMNVITSYSIHYTKLYDHSGGAGIHGPEKRLIILGFPHSVNKELHDFRVVHGVYNLAEYPNLLHLLFGQKELFLPGTGLLDAHRGEKPAVRELPVQVDFHVARALEFLEDNLVHSASGLDEGRGDDGETPPLLHVSGGAEKALRLVEGVGVHATGKNRNNFV